MLAVTQLSGWGGAGQDDASIGGGVMMSGMQAYRSAALTGSTLSKLCTCSFWFRRATYGLAECLFAMRAQWINSFINTDDTISFASTTDGINNDIYMYTSAGVPHDQLWHHIAFSYDLLAGQSHLYLDGIDRQTLVNRENVNVDWRAPDFIVGSQTDSGNAMYSTLAEFYLNPKEYLDLSLPHNLAKFRNAAGKPVELGGDGSRPTGTRPLVYMRHVNKASPDDMATNRGTGGALTRVGSSWEDPLWVSSPWKQIFGCQPTTPGGLDYTGFTTRTRIPTTAIYNKPPGQTQARVTLSIYNTTIGKCYIGNQGGADPWDATNLVQVFFNGSPGVTIAGDSYATSDPVVWTHTGGAILVTIYYTSAPDLIMCNAWGVQVYYKGGDEAGTLNVSGYASDITPSLSYALVGIEMV